MKVAVEIDANFPADGAGEILLRSLNTKGRWGYTTRDFTHSDVREIPIDPVSDLIPLTLCLSYKAKLQQAQAQVMKYRDLVNNIDIFLYWDGDGVLVFRNNDEGWIVYNIDMKCDYTWKWLEEDSWVHRSMSLPDYYTDKELDTWPFVYE